MAEFRELIVLQQNSRLPAMQNSGGMQLAQRSLQRMETIEAEVLPAMEANSDKMLQELKRQTKLLDAILNVVRSESAEVTREDRLEAQKASENQSKILENIEENTRPESTTSKSQGFKLEGIGTSIAIALGGIVGVVQGYIKTLKFFGIDLTKAIEKVKAVFNSFISKGSKIFDSALNFFKNMFSGEGGMSKIVSVFSKIKDTFIIWFEPIVKAFKSIEEGSKPVATLVQKVIGVFDNVVNSIKGFFELVSGKLSSFTKVFGGVAKIVSKLAFPLTVIMTIWDTVKATIEGFEKDGIVGAISGAIKGFVNSLIMAPLDLLKDGISWILDAFGFDKASKFLDSFSFEDIFNEFTDDFFKPIKEVFEQVVDFFTSLKDSVIGMLQSISIPEISFTIPIIDKKVSIGPFYPFGKTESAPTSNNLMAAQPSTKSSAKAQPSTESSAKAQPSTESSAKAQPSTKSSAKAQPKVEVQAPKVMTDEEYENDLIDRAEKDWDSLSSIEKGEYSKGGLWQKAAARREAQIAKPVMNADAEDEAWRKFEDSMNAKSGNWAPVAPETSTANNVYEQSAQNAGSLQARSNSGDGNVIVAPTTNVSNNTSNTVVRIPSRNNDLTINEYYSSRYAF